MRIRQYTGSILIVLAASIECALAEPAPIPFAEETYHRSHPPLVINPGKSATEPFSTLDVGEERPPTGPFVTVEVVNLENAAAIRLHFSELELGEHSRLIIRSVADGSEQTLTSSNSEGWDGMSAIFNGSAVEVILEVSALDKDVTYRIDKVFKALPETADEAVSRAEERKGTEESAFPEAICGRSDDRISSSDARVGRIVPVGCTGWIIDGGLHLTAGHCVNKNNPEQMSILEFNVPQSTGIGIIQFAKPKDQYKIKVESIVLMDDGDGEEGNDWAVFAVERNTETGLYPNEVQGAHYTISRDPYQGDVRITGYGVDNSPPVRNQIQQTHFGNNLKILEDKLNDVTLSYTVDTRGGNSGSPIVIISSSEDMGMVAIGIHTNAGCDMEELRGNKGTGFRNALLWSAIKNFDPNAKGGPREISAMSD